MQRSTERILTTHAGSLPRPASLLPLVLAQEQGESVESERLEAEVRSAVWILRHRRESS
jgi:5-methyltetrahydropteroyltriglutamate--homocysteine methyltransferase